MGEAVQIVSTIVFFRIHPWIVVRCDCHGPAFGSKRGDLDGGGANGDQK
jgi:hypothetical protein